MRLWPRKGEMVERHDAEPLEGTNMSLFNSIIPSWWQENMGTGGLYATPSLADRVWVASRCIQLNAQQIKSMPLHFEGPDPVPEWLTRTPDPNLFPNGISDALFAIVSQIYKWGFSCQYVLSRYADGWPRNWTVLDSSALNITIENGARAYKLGDDELDPGRVIQIDRDPGLRAHGTPALYAYAQQAYGLLAAGNQSMNVNSGGIPQAVLKSQRKLTSEQAEALQEQWMTATSRRSGAPPVLPPELDFEALSFNPSDLALLETQQFNAVAIAAAYGVPAMLLNMVLTGGLPYQNPAMLGEAWWRFELRPMAKGIADAFSNQMLPYGQEVWFDAADTFAPLTPMSSEDDPQAATDVAEPAAVQQLRPVVTGGSA